MKQLFIHKGQAVVKDVPPPLLTPDNVLVQVYYSCISPGTENATINNAKGSLLARYFKNMSQYTQKLYGAVREHGLYGTRMLAKEKSKQYMALGYSCAGKVIAVGNRVVGIGINDFIACAGTGFASHAHIVSVPQNLTVKLSAQTIVKEASSVALGAIALQGLRRANVQLGETVCVIGLGFLGHILLQMLKNAGCHVIAVDLSVERLALAKKYGADLCICPKTHDVAREINFFTQHRGVDVTLITAGSSQGFLIQQSMEITRKKGRVVLVGDVKIDFDRDPFYSKEIDFLISCSYGPGRYDSAYEQKNVDYPYPYVRWTEQRNMTCYIEMLEKRQLNIQSLLTSEYSIDQAASAYASLSKNQAMGAVLAYGDGIEDVVPAHHEKSKKIEQTTNFVAYKVPPSSHINVGVIGCGGFCKVKLLPTISRFGNVSIQALCDLNQAQALTLGHVYKTKYTGNDYHMLLEDESIHAVIIATPHALHAQQSIDALQAGKAVFVEKPAAVTYDDLKKLESFLSLNPRSLFCVDFNRSFAPFMQTIKENITQRSTPLMINYEMNAGLLPRDHWIQSDQNKGRIIGEACHIFELFCFLTGSLPASVQVQTPFIDNNSFACTDNVIAIVKMKDGSCCSLMYTAVGHSGAGKEHMHVHVDGKTIVMHDYVSLEGHGFSKSFSKKVRTQDKGHEDLLKIFFQAARDNVFQLPIPTERMLAATQLSLIVDELVRQGGGSHYFKK